MDSTYRAREQCRGGWPRGCWRDDRGRGYVKLRRGDVEPKHQQHGLEHKHELRKKKERRSSAVPSTRSPPALPTHIAPGHPASLTPPPTAVTV